MADLFVGLGSNLGDRTEFLRSAVRELRQLADWRFRKLSSFRLTAPVGGIEQPHFVNAVAWFDVSTNPFACLRACQRIELRRGRVRAQRHGPRTLDLDLLCFGAHRIDHTKLQLPHPRLVERNFALVPLAELAPRMEVGGTPITRCLADLQSEVLTA